MFLLRVIWFIKFTFFGCISFAYADQNQSAISETVRSIIYSSPSKLNYGSAKLAFDKSVDPSVDIELVFSKLDAMETTVKKMLSTIPASERTKSVERMKALRTFIYSAGAWNNDKPFEYDLDDPFGQKLQSQLLSTYLSTRKGNCISMPILFLALGERLGLDLSLSTAPLHVMIKYTDDQNGETYNLETTSGGGFTRASWYQKKSPMTKQAIDNGVYLQHLSRQETLSVMAMIVVEHLIDVDRYEEAILVSDVILEAYPKYAFALAKKGTAYGYLLRKNFIKKYPSEKDIPVSELPKAMHLFKQNQLAFQQAEQLGWREYKLQ